MRLKGKRGIVTGGGSGIGRAIVLSAASEGARVLTCGRRASNLNATAVMAAPQGSVVIHPCDLTRAESVAALARRAQEEFEGLDFLVNCVGISGMNPLDRSEGQDPWDTILMTNLTAPYRLSREVLPLFGDAGRIVNISSVLGKFGVAGYSAYCSSKHGIIGLTRALAQELACRSITVNAICPGWVETDMAEAGMVDAAQRLGISKQEFRTRALAQVPLGRILQPEEVSPLAVYLLSEESAGMTGQAINLSGGATTA